MPPTEEDLARLTERLSSLIERIFLDHGVPDLEAEPMLQAALVRLSYKWDRIKDHEGWLLRALADEARTRFDPPLEEPDDA